MKKEDLENIKVEKKPQATVEITGEIPFEYLENHRDAAVKAAGKDIEVDGFRKGHVPEDVLVKKIGEMGILSEMAERALREVYPELVKMHELDVIGYPQISLTKLAKDNPLGFTITVAVVPEITLPDYMAIAKDINKKKESKEVTDEEVETQIKEILRQKVAYERLQEKAAKKAEAEQKQETQKDLGGATELPTPDKVDAESGEGDLGQTVEKKTEEEHVHDENCDHDHDEEETPIEKPEDIPLPELTDEYVKTLGQPGQFESVEDFKTKIKEHLVIQKAQDIDAKHRAAITDAVVEKTEMELPQVLIDAEIGQMFAQMEQDLQRAQLKMEDYLSHIKKTQEDLKKDWTPSAEKRAKLQLVLNEISKKEEITPDPSMVDTQVDQIMEQHKDADKERVRVYVMSAMANEEVLKKLEAAE